MSVVQVMGSTVNDLLVVTPTGTRPVSLPDVLNALCNADPDIAQAVANLANPPLTINTRSQS